VDLELVTGDVFNVACDILKGSLSTEPTKKELVVVELLINSCVENINDGSMIMQAMGILRETADRWNDAGLFLRAVRTGQVDKDPTLLSIEGFVSAYQAFDWDALRPLYVGCLYFLYGMHHANWLQPGGCHEERKVK
jgi:hypothetical protein